MNVAVPNGLFVWQQNLVHAFSTHDVIILHGNIGDRFILSDQPYHYECTLEELLVRSMFERYGPLFVFDRYQKAVELSLGENRLLKTNPESSFGQPNFEDTLPAAIVRVLGMLQGEAGHRWCMFRRMHNILPYKSHYGREEQMEAVAFQRLVEVIRPCKKLVLEYLSDTQVPQELASGCPRAVLVRIPMPDEEERAVFFQCHLPKEVRRDELLQLAKLTDGLSLSALQALLEQARRGVAEDEAKLNAFKLADWQLEIRKFKFGQSRDPYTQIEVQALNQAQDFFITNEGVKGQDDAVGKVIQMLWKARTKVGGLLREGNPPRGVLFFCGPSGTGKTMLGQKLAKFLFGAEDKFHRFDMSEFQQDHTVSKLIGSPPGYVGYEEGGLLTNAIAQKPFSVVLFDEIEKAHPRIFDLFLQILSDGRLTDSRGKTIFFSESVIIFTSNLGTRQQEQASLIQALDAKDPEKVRQHFVKCVRDFFRYEISRPELLNRFGNNIVPFNYINAEEVQRLAVGFYLDKLEQRFNEEYRARRLTIRFDPRDTVVTHVVKNHGKDIAEFGGRAIVNVLDDILLTELAQRVLGLEINLQKGPMILRVSAPVDGRAGNLIVT